MSVVVTFPKPTAKTDIHFSVIAFSLLIDTTRIIYNQIPFLYFTLMYKVLFTTKQKNF